MNVSEIFYLDNAATTWPKPPEVGEAMARFLRDGSASAGRSAHRMALEAGRCVYAAREAVAGIFNAPDPLRVVFGLNATDALNTAFRSLLAPGDHVVTTSMEHNSVMRPLRAVAREGVALTIVRCAPDGTLDPAAVAAALRPNTALIVITHASNVTGTLLPAADVGETARRHGALLLVDAAQTAGAVPIDIERDAIDLLVFTGHKSLYGPTGTGGLVVGPRVDAARMRPVRMGGTGSRSEHEEQPAFLPDLLESGTPNTVGLCGLEAGIGYLVRRGVAPVRAHECALVEKLLEGLAALPGVTVYGSGDAHRGTAVVSFTVRGIAPSDVGHRLDAEFGVMARVGLHCAPAAHRTIGTFPGGTVRFSLGAFSSAADVDAALEAVAAVAGGAR